MTLLVRFPLPPGPKVPSDTKLHHVNHLSKSNKSTNHAIKQRLYVIIIIVFHVISLFLRYSSKVLPGNFRTNWLIFVSLSTPFTETNPLFLKFHHLKKQYVHVCSSNLRCKFISETT